MNSISAGAFCPQIDVKALLLPIVPGKVNCGFPSPADDFTVKRLDLNDLITHPLATFFWKTSGRSMIEAGIDDGDILVVNRALRPLHRHIVVGIISENGKNRTLRPGERS
jgi:DNA polymerase V